ncbi:MarR family winged helix-turn-helix transcriptional regulator [Kitasatospora nipponensis]|uniref:MarR family winged helix-turn-helix transcriptional regulator n=1 Tax=Kitasatospora nipponensis TaxID=258049 RepID=A0ABN1WMU5_9ACTN
MQDPQATPRSAGPTPAPAPANAAQVVADQRIRAVGVLLNTSALVERVLGSAIQREAGISHSMFEVLLILAADAADAEAADPAAPAGTPMRRLSGGLVLTSGGATRLIDRMVEAGLVTRTPSESDRRVQLVRMTGLGESTLVTAAAAHIREADRLVGAALSPTEASGLTTALDRLGHQARAALPPLG